MSLIGTLAVNVIANTAAIEQGLNKARGKVSEFSKSMDSIGMGGAWQAFQGINGALTSMLGEAAPVLAVFEQISAAISEGAQRAGDLADKAEQVGLKASQYAGMQDAAAESGAGPEAVTAAMHRLNEQLGQVKARNQEVIESFKAMGLNPFRMAAGDTAQAMKQIADRVAQIQNPMERAALLTELFGKQGRELGPLFAQGAAGIDKMIAAAKESGRVLTDAEYAQADAAAKQQERYDRSVDARNQRMAASPIGQMWTQATTELGTVLNDAVGDLFMGGTENAVAKMQRLAKESEEAKRAQEALVAEGDKLEEQNAEAVIAADKRKAAERHLAEMTKKAEELTRAVQKPEEIYQKTIADLEEMNKLGLINNETAARAEKQAAEVRDRASGLGDRKSQVDLASKAMGSQEAFATWARQQNFMGGFKGDENEKKIEKNTGEAVKVLEEMRTGINEMRNAKPVTFKVVNL